MDNLTWKPFRFYSAWGWPEPVRIGGAFMKRSESYHRRTSQTRLFTSSGTSLGDPGLSNQASISRITRRARRRCWSAAARAIQPRRTPIWSYIRSRQYN